MGRVDRARRWRAAGVAIAVVVALLAGVGLAGGVGRGLDTSLDAVDASWHAGLELVGVGHDHGPDTPADRAWTVRSEGRHRPGPRLYSPAEELARVGALPAGWRASVHIITSAGRPRDYLLVTPSTATAAVHSLPLFVVLHGRHMDPAAMERISGLVGRTGPAVLAYPAGWGESWNAGGCCGLAHRAGVDDVAFLQRVVDHLLATDAAIDPRRVYAVGFSNGGRMTYRLACQLPGVFAGIAAVEAVPVAPCGRLHPLDVEIIAQRGDPLLAITAGDRRKTMQGYVEPTVAATVATWSALDGCRGAPSVRTDGRATTTTWLRCASGAGLQYTLYQGGGHRWPDGGRATPSGDQVILGWLDRAVTRYR